MTSKTHLTLTHEPTGKQITSGSKLEIGYQDKPFTVEVLEIRIRQQDGRTWIDFIGVTSEGRQIHFGDQNIQNVL